MYVRNARLMPVISQAFLLPFSRFSHAFGKGLASSWNLLGFGSSLATPWVELGYTEPALGVRLAKTE